MEAHAKWQNGEHGHSVELQLGGPPLEQTDAETRRGPWRRPQCWEAKMRGEVKTSQKQK